MDTSKKITRFEDMPVWQAAQDVAVSVYKLTKSYPDDELYALTNQMRRASSSISANIAEGFGRNSNKDRAHFYHIALGSLLETKNFIYLSAKLSYITDKQTSDMVSKIEDVHKQITAILRYFRNNE